MSKKTALVIGIANERSLAWGIAQKLSAQGWELGVNFLNEKMEKRVRPLAESLNAKLIEPLDVNSDAEMESFFSKVKEKFGTVDAVIHSVAFANREDLEGRFMNTSRAGFLTAMETSVFSFVQCAKFAEPLMPNGGALITLSYLGAARVIPNYNVMGVAKAALESSVRYLAADLGPQKIRVNAISAGPVKTLSASGIKDFKKLLDESELVIPLRENIDNEDVGELAAFLCGPGGKRITGETIYVDSGAHII
jgi:enoyl-[acyl-carrier protein] reductase I